MAHPRRLASILSRLLRIPSDLLIGLFGLVLIAAAWLVVTHEISADRTSEIERIHRENGALARTFEEHVRRVILTADNALRTIKHEFEKHGAISEDLLDLIAQAKHDPIISQIGVVDASGLLVASAVPHEKVINISRNQTFRVHAASSTVGLYIGKPIITQLAGTWSFYLTRRLNRADGGFAGVVTVGLDPAYFSNFYDELEIGPDRAVLLVGRDGIVRARRFQKQSEVGQDLSGTAMFARIAQEPVGSHEVVGTIDQLRRFASYRALPDLPLIVAVSELSSSALAPFEQRRIRSLSSAAGFTLFVAVFCSVLIAAGRRERRQGEQLSLELAERQRVEAALREAGERYRDLFENANDAIYVLDERQRYVDMNRRAAEIFGYTREEFLGRSVLDVIPPEQTRRSEAAFRELAETGRYNRFEGRMRTKDGRWLDIEVSSSAILRNGVFAGSRDIVRDVTERRLAEKKIRRNEEFIRSILDTVDEGFIVVDQDYRILTANKAYCVQVSLPGDAVIGRRCHEVTHKSDRPCAEIGEECAVRLVYETGTPHTAVHKHPGPDGQLLFVETKAFPIKDDAGNTTSVIETLNNITERQLLEEERLKTQKLESIGTLAGGIAHDFNNLLQGVFGYISLAKMSIDREDGAFALIEEAEKALHQSVSLTTQLLTFSKGGKPVRETIALGPVLENAVKFALSGSRNEYRMALDTGLWPVDADAGQIGQVIQNIAINADQAMPHGGCLVVTARNVPPSDPESPPDLARRRHVLISLQDSGAGIPEQDLDRIFDPYFTTKEQGSGLGLATSYSIVRNHEGRIFARSAPGRGSTFFVYLPAAAASGAAPHEEPIATKTPQARILVMDDDEMIRNVAEKLLAALGHTVALANNGEAAIEAYRAARDSGRPFDIVILDLTVRGGMGGAETMRKLRAIDPDVKAIASSGYSDDAAPSGYREQGFTGFLKKPYTIKELQDILRVCSQEGRPR